MKYLVLRPTPKDNEYILGYLLRLINVNHIHKPYEYLSSFTNAKSLRSALANFSNLNFDIENFSKSITKDINVITTMYTDDIKINNHPKICTYCYLQDGFIHKKWLSPLQLICENHQAFLVSKCHQCGRILEWQFLQFSTCRTCKNLILSPKIEKSLFESSPYLNYWIYKRDNFELSTKELISILSFFLNLILGTDFFSNRFGNLHGHDQTKILESFDKSLNLFMKSEVFEEFLLTAYERSPFDIQFRDHFFKCFMDIDPYINDKSIRNNLIESIKKSHFLKMHLSNKTMKTISDILSFNSNYITNQCSKEQLQRNCFDLVTLYQFKYITKTHQSTLKFLIDNNFIQVLKNKNGTYKYISVYSLYKLMALLRSYASILTREEDLLAQKFVDLSTEEKQNFLFSLLSGKPVRYEFSILKGIDHLKLLNIH